MFHNKSFYTLLSVFALGIISVKAQDSIRLYPIINNQFDIERNIKQSYYYNPANKSDYSSLSFTDFGVSYHKDDQKSYRQQLGSGSEGLDIAVTSYKKQKSNRSIWGSASYQNLKLNSLKWNETLDYDRVAPYSIADSIGGTTKVERYQFSGGLAQNFNRWTIGVEANYIAQLGSRSKDPRVNSTTSDLSINLGINYKVYRDYEVGAFGQFNKYTQNTSISFVNLLGQPLTYHMTGLGYSNYFFSTKNPAAIYQEYAYKVGGQIFSKKSKDFYLQASLGQSNNVKSIKPGNTDFDASDLENKNYQVEAAKFFTIKNHRFGVLANYNAIIKTGSEYGYTNNTQFTEQIYKRKTYKKEDYITNIKGFYQYNWDKSNLAVIPFFTYQETTEQKRLPFTGQKYDAYTLGLETHYKQEIVRNQVLSLSPYFSKKTVNKAINAISKDLRPSILDWVLQDYYFLTSDVTTFGASLRYDVKLENLPAFYINAQYQSQKIQEKNNNFAALSLGITF